MTPEERKKLQEEALKKQKQSSSTEFRKRMEAQALEKQRQQKTDKLLARTRVTYLPSVKAQADADIAGRRVMLEEEEKARQRKIEKERAEQSKYRAKQVDSVEDDMGRRVADATLGATYTPEKITTDKRPVLSDINRSAANVNYEREAIAAKERYEAENHTRDMSPLQALEHNAQKYNPLALADMAINQTGAGVNRFIADALAGNDKVKGYIDNAQRVLRRYNAPDDYRHEARLPSVQDRADEYSAKMAEKYVDITDTAVTKALSDLASSTGYMIPAMLSNSILPYSGTALLFTTGYTSGEREALRQGATADEARAYALLNGLNQSIGETIIGGVGGAGKGLINSVFARTGVSLIDKITNPTLKAAAQLGLRALGEGAEEVIQGVADTAFRKMTYEPSAKIDPAGLAYEGVLGGAMGATFGAPEFVRDISAPTVKAEPQTDTYYRQRIDDIRAQETSLHGRLRTADEDIMYNRLLKSQSATEKSGILSGASDEMIASAARIADKGLDIVFERVSTPSGQGVIDGYAHQGKLYVNPESPNALSFIAGHELTHTIEKSKTYDKFSQYVLNRIGNDKVAAERARIKDLRQRAGMDITDEQVTREIVADFAGRNLMTSEADIVDMVRTDRTLGERIKSWLDDMVTRLTGTEEEKFYVRARDLYRKALAEARRGEVAATASASVSATDTDYMAAVEHGDKAEQERIVTEAAKRAGYTVKAYHGTSANKDFTVFDTYGSRYGLYGIGSYFTEDPEIAQQYTKKGKGKNPRVYPVFLRPRNTLDMDAPADIAAWKKAANTDDIEFDFSKVKTNSDAMRAIEEELAYEEYTAWEGAEFITDTIQGMGYNSLTHIGGKIRGDKEHRVWIMYEPEQIKSAEPITYDEEGNVIPPSRRFDDAKANINYSVSDGKPKDIGDDAKTISQQRKTIKELEKSNAKLRELNEAQRKQFQKSVTVEPSVFAVTKFIRELKQRAISKTPTQQLLGKLSALYGYFGTGDRENNVIDWRYMYDYARDIAEELLAGSKIVQGGEEFETFSRMKKYLRKQKFYISRQDAANLAGGYDTFRRKNMGRFFLTTDPSAAPSIDESFDDLRSEFGESNFPANIGNHTDMMNYLSQLIDKIEEKESNAYGEYFDEAAAFYANEILDRFYDIPQAKPTLADRHERDIVRERVKYQHKLDSVKESKRDAIAKVKETARAKAEEQTEREKARLKRVREQLKAEVDKRLSDMRTKSKESIQKLKDEYQRRAIRTKQSQSRTQLRKRIRARAKRMLQMISTPEKNSHVPDELKATVAQFFEMLASAPDDIIKKGDNAGKVRADALKNKLQELSDVYQRILTGEDAQVVVDGDMQEMFREASEALSKSSFVRLGTEQLDNLYKLSRAIYKSISTANKTFADAKQRAIDELAESVRVDNAKKNPRKQGKAGSLPHIGDTLFNFSMMEPRTLFKRLGGTMYELYRNIERGQDKYIDTVTKTVAYAQDALKDIDIHKWDGDTADKTKIEFVSDAFEGKTTTVEMTRMMIIDLYLASKRAQAQKHLYGKGEKGGMSLKMPGDGKPSKPIKVTPEIVDEILRQHLSPEMRKVGDALQKYVAEDMAMLGNEVTNQLNGYSKFTDPDYWTIEVYQGTLNRKYGETEGDPQLENVGMAKTVQRYATNALVIKSALDTFDKHTVQMAAYNAYVPALSDFKRVMNNKDMYGVTVRGMLDDIYGDDAGRYIDRFLRLVNTGKLSRNLWNDELSRKMIRAYKSAAVGLNLSVILKQPVSYIRAASMISPKYLIQAMVSPAKSRKSNTEEMLRLNPIARIKDWGYADMGFGKNQRQLYDDSAMTLFDKTAEVTGKLPSVADKLTWGRIWQAVKLEQQAKGEYDRQAWADRFRDVISTTQVVNTIFDTPSIMQEESVLTTMVTAFMGEPLKTYNAMYGAAQTGDKKQVVRTASALTANALAVAAITTMFSLLRKKDDEEINAAAELAKNVVTDMVGVAPYVRDILSMFEGYDAQRMDMAGAEKLVSAVKNLYADGARLIMGETMHESVYGHLINVATGLSYVTGMPASNVIRDVESIVRRFAEATGNADLEFAMAAMLNNPEYKGDRSTFYDLLYKYRNDDDAYNKIKRRLIDYGFTDDTISSAMATRYKRGDEYKDAYKPIEERALRGIEDNAWFNALPEADKEAITGQVKSYASALALDKVDDDYTLNATAKKIQAAVEDGLSPGEYLLYTTARKKADDGNGSYNAKEKIKAIRELDWMSASKRRALLILDTRTEDNPNGIGDELDAITDAGIDFDEFLSIYERHYEIGQEDLKASQQAAKFAQWLDGRYTEAQSDVVQENFGYWSGSRAEPAMYNNFADAGLDIDAAYTLADAVSKLVPAEGKKAVSAAQKYRVIAESDLTNPDKDRAMSAIMSETAHKNYMKARLRGLKVRSYVEYIEGTAGIESDLKNGEPVSGSRKQKVLTYIDRMLIPNAHKDLLYALAGYSASTISDAPWRGGVKYIGNVNKRKVTGLPKKKG